MEKILDLSVHEDRNSNIFDGFARIIEKVSLEGNFASSAIAAMYSAIGKSILRIERRLQDLLDVDFAANENDLHMRSQLMDRIKSLLFSYLVIFNQHPENERFVSHIAENLRNIDECLSMLVVKAASLEDGMSYLLKMPPTKTQDRKARSFLQAPGNEKIHDVATKTYAYELGMMLTSEKGPIRKKTVPVSFEELFEWNVDFSTSSNNISQISFLLWVLSSGLENIDGVTIELTDWGKGSFWAKLTAKIKGVENKIDFIDILGKSLQATEDYYLNQHIEGVARTVAERKIFEGELDRKPTIEESKELTQLELESKRLAYKQQQIDYDLKKLEYVKRLSELIRDGLIQIDSDFTLLLEGQLVCKKIDGKFQIGDNLHRIGSDETGPIAEA